MESAPLFEGLALTRRDRSPRRAHLVGVAGSGMRALADVLLGWGWRLSGSDMVLSPGHALAAAGVRLCTGHSAENLAPDTELVVASDAVPADNPERKRATELGIPTLSYFQMIGRLMDQKHGVAVAGTHGKSTTTAMAAHVLANAGLDPTVACGATPLGQASGGRAGASELMLVEACEYRENFLHLRPRHAAILGIEPDHFDYYRSPQQLHRAFARFARTVPPDGLLLARADCVPTGQIVADLSCRVEGFDVEGNVEWSARNLTIRQGRYAFAIHRHWRRLCDVRLQVPGRHNVFNALAAAALVWENGVEPGEIGRLLSGFAGLRRRLETLGCFGGVTLLDDFAHHPTEVSAALAAARQMFPDRRLWCVFQPHQVSRTDHLLGELAASLQNADRVFVAEIFRAREKPPVCGEVTSADLARLIRRPGVEVPDCHACDQITQRLRTDLVPGDVLMTVGAGDIRKIAEGLQPLLRRRPAA